MASTPRVLGKGRVIGKPTSTPTPPTENLRQPIIVSPSASSTSLNSQISNSKSSTDDTDISAAVALQSKSNNQNIPSAAAAAGSRLICPICSEGMVTLLQLNRHLDDSHKYLEEEEQDEVKTWFKTQVVKAKKFQPLAVLNQKLKGLDIFEVNEDRRPTGTLQAPQQQTIDRASPQPVIQQPVDPDEYVTRNHWQRYTRDGLCSDPLCGKHLGPVQGNINCRNCGKLFCEEHTMYQMKLSRSAQHEPVRGYWCRVCETCYKSREGYNDHTGRERDHMKSFAATRRKAVDKSYLEISRMEKRLTKLTQLLADPRLEQEQGGAVGYMWSMAGYKNNKRAAEESVVEWEDDASVANCPFCKQEFSSYTFRRHHCRLCGRVVCADPNTACSSDVALDVAAPPQTPGEKPSRIPVDVRMCKDCQHTVFSKADFVKALHHVPADQRAFENLKQFERGIRIMLPRFSKLLALLQDPEKPPTPSQLAEATKVRKRLTDSFTQYEIAARRIRDTPTESPTQRKLQTQVHSAAASFLHIHMLPLKSLPKVLKHASPHGRSASASSFTDIKGNLSPQPQGRGPLAAIKRNASHDESSQTSSTSRLSELETEEKQLREELIVLEEQKFLVSEMIADAQKRRKFEEVESLGRNLEDLSRELDRVQGRLETVGSEVRGVYLGDGVS